MTPARSTLMLLPLVIQVVLSASAAQQPESAPDAEELQNTGSRRELQNTGGPGSLTGIDAASESVSELQEVTAREDAQLLTISYRLV